MGIHKRTTDWHEKALFALRRSAEPMSAYDVLGALRRFNPKIAPTTVYRALTVLEEHGQIHRLESLNAYMVCQCDHHQQAPILSICDGCGAVEESLSPEVLSALSMVSTESGFSPSRQVIELHGRCGSCNQSAAQ